MDEVGSARERNARTKIALVALLCFAPALLAWLLASGAFGWRPAGSAAYGEILPNPVALPTVLAHGPEGVLQLPAGLGRFTHVYVSAGPCRDTCSRALERMRRVELGSGKQVVKLQRLLITRTAAPPPRSLTLPPTGYFAVITETDWPAWATVLGAEPAAVFIADPVGRLILRYPIDFDLKRMVQDGKRLLGIAGH